MPALEPQSIVRAGSLRCSICPQRRVGELIFCPHQLLLAPSPWAPGSQCGRLEDQKVGRLSFGFSPQAKKECRPGKGAPEDCGVLLCGRRGNAMTTAQGRSASAIPRVVRRRKTEHRFSNTRGACRSTFAILIVA